MACNFEHLQHIAAWLGSPGFALQITRGARNPTNAEKNSFSWYCTAYHYVSNYSAVAVSVAVTVTVTVIVVGGDDGDDDGDDDDDDDDAFWGIHG